MRYLFVGLAAAATVTLGGCTEQLDITNPNTPSQATAAQNPRDASIRLIVGVLAGYRANRPGSINSFGSYGRETYNMTPQDGRSITGPYRDHVLLNAFTAGAEWGRYGSYRDVYATIKIVDGAQALTTAEQKGALGVLNTFLALNMLHIIEARGAIGAPVDMSDNVNEIFPFVSQDSVYKWITNKLDAANADLGAAGGSFYFPMHTGFTAFGVAGSTPAGFARFNRAIKARVEAKRGSLGCGTSCYQAALTALGGSFLAELTAANRDAGIYVIFSTAAGDALNGSSFATNSNLYVHPLIDNLPGAVLDDRYRRKVNRNETSATEDDLCAGSSSSRALVGATGNWRPCTYAANVAPMGIVRNEELILIRAEARWYTGDLAGARADLATVRTTSGADRGGTASTRFPNAATAAEFVDELLLQRTLSLFQEGHRYADYRRFNKLAELGTWPQDITAGFTVAARIVLPQLECDVRARGGAAPPPSCPGGG